MNTDNSTSRGTVILVLGMHRSGTSAITRVLNLLGVPLGHDLLPPQDDNDKGFWEHARAMAINERLLGALDRNWHDIREMPAGWMEHPAALEAREEISGLLHGELAPNGLWAVKDPRICRLAPLWLSVLEQEGVKAKAIVMVRDPREVALSLQKRDSWTLAHSYLMWVQHFVEALEATRDVPRAMVTYDGLLTDWRETVQRLATGLDVVWPVGAKKAGAKISSFLSPSDRHHRVAVGGDGEESLKGSLLPSLLGDLHAGASAVAAGQLDWSALAGPVDIYHDAVSIFAQPVAELMAERNELERVALERMEHINGLVTAKETAESHETELGGQLEQVQSLLQAREMDINGLHVSIEECRVERATLEAQARERDSRIEALSLDQRELMTLRGALESERDYIERAFNMSDRMEVELREQIQEMGSRLLREQEAHSAAFARLVEGKAQLEADLQERRAEAVLLQGRADAQMAQEDDLRSQLAGLGGELAELRATHAGLHERSASELEAARQRSGLLLAERDALAQSLQVVEDDLSVLRCSHGELDERHRMAASSLQAAQGDLAELRQAHEALGEQHRVEGSRLQAAQAELVELGTAIAALETRRHQEVSELQSRTESLLMEQAGLHSRIEEATREGEALQRELTSMRDVRTALEERVGSLEARLDRANDQASRAGWLLGRAWKNVIGRGPGGDL